MATQIGGQPISSILFGRVYDSVNLRNPRNMVQIRPRLSSNRIGNSRSSKLSIQCSEKQTQNVLRTCKNCKTQFDPLLNHPRACRYHTAHFGGSFLIPSWLFLYATVILRKEWRCAFCWCGLLFVPHNLWIRLAQVYAIFVTNGYSYQWIRKPRICSVLDYVSLLIQFSRIVGCIPQ